MTDPFLAGCFFGGGSVAIAAVACIAVYRLKIQHWLTTESADVHIVEERDGYVMVQARLRKVYLG